MQNLNFVSEEYSHVKQKDCRLSISIRRNGFSFLITKKNPAHVLAYSYVNVSQTNREEAFKKFLSQLILQGPFESVSIIIVISRFTLVPKKLYDDSMLDSYANMNFEHCEDESIITYESINSDSVVIFPIETSMWAMCRSAYKDQQVVSYVPQVAPMLEANIKTKGEKLCVAVENDFFTTMFVKDKKLRFCNAFAFSNINDFVYYVMNVINQLHLNPLEIQVELSGKISAKSPYFSALQVFAKNVAMVKNPIELPRFPYTLFYNHCNIGLCE